MKVGSKVRFSYPHLFEVVHFSAVVVKIEGEFAWVRMPEKVRRLPFPPLGGKKYGKYAVKSLKEVS